VKTKSMIVFNDRTPSVHLEGTGHGVATQDGCVRVWTREGDVSTFTYLPWHRIEKVVVTHIETSEESS
jgi:hypothetical protein